MKNIYKMAESSKERITMKEAIKHLENIGYCIVPASQYTIVIDPISEVILAQGTKSGTLTREEILQDLVAEHIYEYVRKLA
jgi:hypothetical protein